MFRYMYMYMHMNMCVDIYVCACMWFCMHDKWTHNTACYHTLRQLMFTGDITYFGCLMRY